MKISKHCFIFIIIFLCIPHVGNAGSFRRTTSLFGPTRQVVSQTTQRLGQGVKQGAKRLSSTIARQEPVVQNSRRWSNIFIGAGLGGAAWGYKKYKDNQKKRDFYIEKFVKPARELYQGIKDNLDKKYSSLSANIIIQNLTKLYDQAYIEKQQKGHNREVENILVHSVESLLSTAAQDPRWAALLAKTIENSISSSSVSLADAFAKADVFKFGYFIEKYPKEYLNLTETMVGDASILGRANLKAQLEGKNIDRYPLYTKHDEKLLQLIANLFKQSKFLRAILDL